MLLNDVTVESKCFDVSQMSLGPLVTDFKPSQGFCCFGPGGDTNAEVEPVSSMSSPSRVSCGGSPQNFSLC